MGLKLGNPPIVSMRAPREGPLFAAFPVVSPWVQWGPVSKEILGWPCFLWLGVARTATEIWCDCEASGLCFVYCSVPEQYTQGRL